jgi:SSS family solute:Na+ symporter
VPRPPRWCWSASSPGILRTAPAARSKDTLIYITVIVAIIYIPAKLGGWAHIFDAAAKVLPGRPMPGSTILQPKQYLAYSTLALGSALALFLYPHSITGVLSSKDRNVVRRNAAVLPAYSFLLGLIALLGYMAIAADVQTSNANMAVPLLFNRMFPSWFRGVAFAAIAIGALVPAAIMSIAAANLFTRNIYREYIRRDAGPAEEARVARLVSLVVKVGALAFILLLKPDYALNLQLLGGIWILQTLPSVMLGLYTRWFHRWALLAGWLAGMATGSFIASKTGFKMAAMQLQVLGVRFTAYAAVTALVVNLAVAVVLTPLLNALKAPAGQDVTAEPDYEVEAAPPIEELAEPAGSPRSS